MAKLLGFVIGLSGAMAFTFFEGPCMYPSTQRQNSDSSAKSNSRGDWIRFSNHAHRQHNMVFVAYYAGLIYEHVCLRLCLYKFDRDW